MTVKSGKWLTSFLFLALTSSAEVFNELTWRNPLPQGNVLWDVAAHKGGYIAVGLRGSVVVSADGSNWVARKWTTSRHFTGIASDANLLVAVGQGAAISEDDGTTWEEIPGMSNASAITYGNSVFVAAVGGIWLFTSANGREWVKTFTITNTAFVGRLSLAFGNGRFVAISAAGAVAVSENGYDWTSAAAPHLTSLNYAEGLFIATDVTSAGNGIWTSPDGVTWTKRHAMPPSGPMVLIYSATRLNGKLIAVGVNISAEDGEGNWVTQQSPRSEYQGLPKTLYCVRTLHERAVAVGDAGSIVTSQDAITWSNRLAGTDFWLKRIAFGNGRFVIVGDGETRLTLTPDDGVRWVPHAYWLGRAEELTFGNGEFVATSTGTQPIATSTNGIDWTPSEISTLYGGWGSVRAVAFGDNRFLALGQRVTEAGLTEDITLTATNPQIWNTYATPETRELRACAYGLGKFVAVGEAGAIASSSDGTWQLVGRPVSNTLSSVAFGPAGFVAVGDAGAILHSIDGAVWNSHPVESQPYYSDVTFGGGYFVAVGASGPSSVISASKDGITWRHFPTPAYGNVRLTGCGYGHGGFVFIGPVGTILQSGYIPPELGIASAGPMRVRVALKGIAGEQYALETALSLGEWEPAATYHLTNDVLEFEEPISGSQKYFRALLLTH